MRQLGIAILVGSMAATACTSAVGAPAPLATTAAQRPAVATGTPAAIRAPGTTSRPSAPADPVPEAFIGAWYHPAPAYWWFLRAGSPTCALVAHTDADCVAYQLGGQAAYVGAATMDGRILRINWTRGYCAGQRTNFGTGIVGDTLKLFDMPDDCGGDNFVFTRAGTGGTPTAPPPPEN